LVAGTDAEEATATPAAGNGDEGATTTPAAGNGDERATTTSAAFNDAEGATATPDAGTASIGGTSAPAGLIEVPAEMALIWTKNKETGSTGRLNHKVLGMRYLGGKEKRLYLLDDLKWYPDTRVTYERKRDWSVNSLKVPMNSQPITIKDAAVLQAFQSWGRFSILPGDSRIDPRHNDELAWKDSIYVRNHNNPVGADFIKKHNANLNG